MNESMILTDTDGSSQQDHHAPHHLQTKAQVLTRRWNPRSRLSTSSYHWTHTAEIFVSSSPSLTSDPGPLGHLGTITIRLRVWRACEAVFMVTLHLCSTSIPSNVLSKCHETKQIEYNRIQYNRRAFIDIVPCRYNVIEGVPTEA